MWRHASMYAVSTVCGAASVYCMHECSRFSKPAGCNYQWKCLGNHSHTQRKYCRMSAASYTVTSMCCLPCLLPALHWHLHIYCFRSRKESTRYTLWSMVHEPQITRGRPDFIARRSIHRFMTSWCNQASLFNNVTTHTMTHTLLWEITMSSASWHACCSCRNIKHLSTSCATGKLVWILVIKWKYRWTSMSHIRWKDKY